MFAPQGAPTPHPGSSLNRCVSQIFGRVLDFECARRLQAGFSQSAQVPTSGNEAARESPDLLLLFSAPVDSLGKPCGLKPFFLFPSNTSAVQLRTCFLFEFPHTKIKTFCANGLLPQADWRYSKNYRIRTKFGRATPCCLFIKSKPIPNPEFKE